jgi:hypothetical protein
VFGRRSNRQLTPVVCPLDDFVHPLERCGVVFPLHPDPLVDVVTCLAHE